jgi:hypothetical protein
MIDVRPDQLVDVDDHPALREGVRLVGGEARCRYLYLEPGESERAVAARWQRVLGPGTCVVSRAVAVATGIFGEVRPEVVGRFGEVIVWSEGLTGVSDRSMLEAEAGMEAHHGGLSTDEMLVPCVQLVGT